jgi:hypothetical protein
MLIQSIDQLYNKLMLSDRLNFEKTSIEQIIIQGNFIPFLPLLEIDWKQLVRSFSELDSSEKLWVFGSRFPYELLVLWALENGSPYWQEKALSWLKADDFIAKSSYLELLLEMVEKNQISPHLRRQLSIILNDKFLRNEH